MHGVQFQAKLDPNLSRGLWLVKWLLAIPHFIVLIFLWIAFALLCIFAFLAILITGRYPRWVFDFNVGVIRWSWRVTFYAFVLGTDKYPPFSLEVDDSYPASFSVEYPLRLSRGLVLVKWWLLAIPHYLVVSLFTGGFNWFEDNSSDAANQAPFVASGGLISLLALIAGVVLLFRGRYPQPVFDFIMGMERWSHRVFAYAVLMRDEYPPFRLDMGGDDSPASANPAAPVTTDNDGSGLTQT